MYMMVEAPAGALSVAAVARNGHGGSTGCYTDSKERGKQKGYASCAHRGPEAYCVHVAVPISTEGR
jgi:hypothetical protein